MTQKYKLEWKFKNGSLKLEPINNSNIYTYIWARIVPKFSDYGKIVYHLDLGYGMEEQGVKKSTHDNLQEAISIAEKRWHHDIKEKFNQ